MEDGSPRQDDRKEEVDEWRRKRALRSQQRREQENGGVGYCSAMDVGNDDKDDDDALLLTAAKRRRMERDQFIKQRQTRGTRDYGKNENTRNFEAATEKVSQPQSSKHDGAPPAGASRKNDAIAPSNDTAPASAEEEETSVGAGTKNVQSLMDQAQALEATLTAQERAERQRQHEEHMLLKQAQAQLSKKALTSAKDVANNVIYDKPMPSLWTIPRHIARQSPAEWQATRQRFAINAEGKDVPPCLTTFQDFKLPNPILKALRNKGIQKPTPIQMQGIPVGLAGRDLVGIAFTGSGKTLAFSLPVVMVALEQELLMPLYPGEGPLCVLLAPSRELARQTFDIITEYLQVLNDAPEYQKAFGGKTLNSLLLIGGENMGSQIRALQETPIHVVVATAGRLRMLLKEHKMTFDNTRLVCLDEADRLLDLGFDEDVGDIFNFFVRQKQTLLFSATFPQKFQDFCRQTLVQPIVVNVGRAGAANLDVIQEVEYVKQDAKLVYLLSSLQKTAPPVCIFSQRQRDVDDIHEYLLLKGIQAVSIHGSKNQSERNEAIRLFKNGEKDVLIATDVAAKGLDFPNIQHVINFDMPSEIENYVHRIGRTGRCGKTGVATTFINKSCDEMTLLDLRALLKEARQRIPPVLEMLEDPRPSAGAQGNGLAGGCSFCGGLGHSIVDCPKIEKDAKRIQRGNYDALQMGGGDW